LGVLSFSSYAAVSLDNVPFRLAVWQADLRRCSAAKRNEIAAKAS